MGRPKNCMAPSSAGMRHIIEMIPLEIRSPMPPPVKAMSSDLEDDLKDDMPPFGADGPLDADLAGALLDNNVHDVGHAHAGDDQRHGPHHAEERCSVP